MTHLEGLGSSRDVWGGSGELCEGLGSSELLPGPQRSSGEGLGRSGEALGISGELWEGGGGLLHGMSISIRLGDRILLFSIRSAKRAFEFSSERVSLVES